jgi:hypothetical protein
MFNILHMWSDLFQDPNWRRQKQIGGGVLRAENRLRARRKFIEENTSFSIRFGRAKPKSRQVRRAEELRELKDIRIEFRASQIKERKRISRIG